METKTENNGLHCNICGEAIRGEYIQASVDRDLKPTENGIAVCSQVCARQYERKLPHHGKPIDHFSRITGYYQKIEGWNAGKIQELKDRKRYGIPGGSKK